MAVERMDRNASYDLEVTVTDSTGAPVTDASVAHAKMYNWLSEQQMDVGTVSLTHQGSGLYTAELPAAPTRPPGHYCFKVYVLSPTVGERNTTLHVQVDD